MSKIFKELENIKTLKKVDELFNNYDDGDLFLEKTYTENFVYDDNKVKNASFNEDKGFGLRVIKEDSIGFAHCSDLNEVTLKNAIEMVSKIDKSKSFNQIVPNKYHRSLYSDKNPLSLYEFKAKIQFLEKINGYARAKDSAISQVSISLAGNYQEVEILKNLGNIFSDLRPLVRLNVSITVRKNNITETGSFGLGGRYMYDTLFNENVWKDAVDSAYNQALIRLEAIETPAGEQNVILGPGWPGILLHEAIGHGLEGDFNRKKTSVFHNLVGQSVASEQITIVDDGTIPDRRGSLTIDDEGTPTQNTVLIENGILKNFMQDRLNAKLMNKKPTGNGRREDYSCIPMPRMTNTYMINGKYEHEELIKSTKNGVYATQFSGGQVDITSGKFVFSASEAFKIVDGKIDRPLKGATLIGNGPEVLKKVSMVANNMKLDNGIGTCGKEGQSVPVGVGQPSLKVDNLTVGGTV
ncbi:MAG: metalloprotease TldD [Rickettsiales bacterium]|nr:metalloprotease TldD [Rickettsiales bacterium]OUV53254.1 MAG: metalloprotease TldD [Rickettsiales bacterium TMED127]|tara:strand:- start:35623 stop:37023 length:1401 start_codon:yes stop_codon:yes gene_type:complete